MNKIKLYIALGLIVAIVGASTYFINTHTIIKNKVVEDYKKQRIADSIRVIKLDSVVFSLQQEVDLKTKTDAEFQIIIQGLSKSLKESRLETKTLNEALTHYENNGLIRYFVTDKRLFRGTCYREVFIKPTNICQ